MDKYTYNPTTRKMEVVKGRATKNVERIPIDAELVKTLKGFAVEDGISLKGVSYLTEKDAQGKTKKDKDGKPVFQLDKDGKKKSVEVAESQAKVNSAIALYANEAIRQFVVLRAK